MVPPPPPPEHRAASATALDPAALARLGEIVGAAHVVTDPAVTAAFATDWTGRFVGATPALVRPGDADEVAGVLGICREFGIAVVPQGGNTGLVGGGVPLDGEILVSLRRLDEVGPVDPLAAQLTAGAGATLRAVQRAAADAGLRYAVDLAARDSATLGGMIATNAGGLHLLAHGGTREQLLGIDAIFGDGCRTRHLSGLVKDNSGYDLRGLLCGSEGTLGIVCAARVRLIPDPPLRVVALVGFSSIAAAVAAVAVWRRHLEGIEAAELVVADTCALVSERVGLPSPFGSHRTAGDDGVAAVVVVEVAGFTDPTARLSDAVAGVDGVVDAAVAADGPRRRALWRYRDDVTLAIAQLGIPHKLDVTLPAAALATFCTEVAERVRRIAPQAHTWLFGHVGDGNIHVNVTGVAPDDDRIDIAVLEHVAELGGAISAEHGIGRAKRDFLHLTRSADELAAMRALKRALDPAGILNPLAVLSPDTAPG